MTSTTFTAGTTGLINSVREFFVNLNEKRIQRRNAQYTIRQLSALTDRELWDMGITRGDIYSVAHGDPSFRRAGSKTNPNLEGWV